MRTCIAGMGMMGSALADALLARIKPVVVWSRSLEKCQSAVGAGAELAGSVAEGAANCDILISCLADYHAVSHVVITDEVARHLTGKTLVQLSQASPDQSREIARWAEANGIGYLDGSILGYPRNIRDNDCMVVYSGPQQVFDSCHEVLHALGANARLVGNTPGMATSFENGGDKLVHGSGGISQPRAEQNSATCSLRSFLRWKAGGCTPWTYICAFGWPAMLMV